MDRESHLAAAKDSHECSKCSVLKRKFETKWGKVFSTQLSSTGSILIWLEIQPGRA
jgi:hypothetical protein